MELGDVIRIRRRELDLTLEDIATACGVGKSIVSKWEHGDVTNLRRNNIESLADVLRVSPLVILGREELDGSSSSYIPEGFQPLPEMVEVPLIGRIACGEPITAEENIEDQVSVPADWGAAFSLRCCGESMLPRIQDGDIVGIRPQPMVENGEIAAVRIGTEATLKHVYLYSNYIELRPENPEYESIIKIGEDMNEVKIEGKAVGLCRKL